MSKSKRKREARKKKVSPAWPPPPPLAEGAKLQWPEGLVKRMGQKVETILYPTLSQKDHPARQCAVSFAVASRYAASLPLSEPVPGAALANLGTPSRETFMSEWHHSWDAKAIREAILDFNVPFFETLARTMRAIEESNKEEGQVRGKWQLAVLSYLRHMPEGNPQALLGISTKEELFDYLNRWMRGELATEKIGDADIADAWAFAQMQFIADLMGDSIACCHLMHQAAAFRNVKGLAEKRKSAGRNAPLSDLWLEAYFDWPDGGPPLANFYRLLNEINFEWPIVVRSQ